MRVSTVDGLVTLFYDGSKELYNSGLDREWWDAHMRMNLNAPRQRDVHGAERVNDFEAMNISNECKRYFRERYSWQQVIVVEGVTAIPASTFRGCKNIKRVIFANTVIRIERYAFFCCRSLIYIEWSLNLEYIGEGALCNCNLSSVFIPPRCREIGDGAFGHNKNLSILHVPQDAQLGICVFVGTTLAKASPLHADRNSWYDRSASNDMHHWLKNMNNDAQFALHRACSSYQPLKEVIRAIIVQKGLKVFREENSAGITPSRYLKENPYTDLTEKEIINDYLMKMMGEVE